MTDQQGPGWDGGMTQPGRVPAPQDTPPSSASPWPSTQRDQDQPGGQYGSGQYGQGQPGQGQPGQTQWPQGQYGQNQQNQWGQNQYGQNQWAQGQYAPGQYAPGQYAPGQYAPGQAVPGPYGAQRTNPMAIAAIVCGGAQLFFWLLTGIPAIILGHLARRQIKQTGEGGAGLALAGLILGYIGVAAAALFIIVIVIAVSAARHHSGSFGYNGG
jgi:Domain of unknown function (DUF4190)